MALGDFTPKSDVRRVNMRATAAINAYEAVKLGTNGVTTAGDGDTIYGFAMSTAATGDVIAIGRGGVWEGQAASAVDFAFADHVYMAASGEIDTGSATNVSMGTVVDKNPAATGKVSFEHNEAGAQTSLFAHA